MSNIVEKYEVGIYTTVINFDTLTAVAILSVPLDINYLSNIEYISTNTR